MKGIPPIKAVMTPFPYWIEIERPLSHAREMMREHRIRHLPVMERGQMVGVLTDRDIERFRSTAEDGASVGDVCERGVYIVALSEPLDRVLLHMAEHHVGSALVTKEGKLAGIFTLTDACRRFGELLRTLFPRSDGDAA